MNFHQAQACIEYYFRTLAEGTGLLWTEQNSDEIREALAALAGIEEGETIPPFFQYNEPKQDAENPNSPSTINDQRFQAWRRNRQEQEETKAVRRLLRRREVDE